MIKLENVDYVYSPGTPFETKALDGINLEVNKCEILGIIGHTGSGKSTLVQLFNALLIPTAGTVTVNGRDTSNKKQPRKDIRADVGMVFQYPEHQIFEETIFDEIAFGPKNLGLVGDDLQSRVDWAMELVDMSPEEKEGSPFELSGGQKRRVAIAGVLAMCPKVLVLDEPTAGLDPKGRRKLLDLIVKMHQKNNLTIVLVSHSMEDIAKIAKRIVVMHKGKIAMEGIPRDVYGKREELEKMGLDTPEIARLMYKFGGYECYTVAEAKEIIEARVSKC